jgi:hypothetical protein
MIENLRRMEMRAGASHRVESTFSSDVKSSIAGVAHSPTQLPLTPNPSTWFHSQTWNLQAEGAPRQYAKVKGENQPAAMYLMDRSTDT